MIIKWLYPKIIKDEQIHLLYFCDLFDVGSISFSHFQHGKELGGIGIKHFVSKHTCLVPQSRSDITFPDIM